MLKHSLAMSCLVVIVVVASCTVPNPESCLDGLCTDQRYPYCDVDGQAAGLPKACIEVDCSPGGFAFCRGGVAVTCNDAGNDYELIECQLGCGATGCKLCSTNDECADPTPVCDSGTTSCRSCRVDSECASEVCDVDSGACVAASDVVYASPTGADSGTCLQTTPCSIAWAILVARANPVRSLVRLLPGTHGPASIPSGKITLVGTDAVIQGGLNVTGGANVTVRGLTIDTVAGELRCAGGATSVLILRDLKISNATGNPIVLVTCDVKLENVVVSTVNSRIADIGDDVVVDADRVSFEGQEGTIINASGQRLTMRITNSIFDGALLFVGVVDQAPYMSQLYLGFNTFYSKSGLHTVNCENSTGANRTVTLENNIIRAERPFVTDAVRGTDCIAKNNLIFPQATSLGATNVIADPRLVDPANHDFHLKPGSPAIDRGVETPGFGTDHDYAGTKRPQGLTHDIGALESVP